MAQKNENGIPSTNIVVASMLYKNEEFYLFLIRKIKSSTLFHYPLISILHFNNPLFRILLR